MNFKTIHVSIFLIIGALLLPNYELLGQKTWDLQSCIDHAILNNIQISISELNVENAEINLKQAKENRYPNLSFGSSLSWNFGRSIDPITNQFRSQNFFNNGINLTSNVVIFNGFSLQNQLKQAQLNMRSFAASEEQTKRDVALNVASLYLSTLFAKENLNIARNQKSLTIQQLDQLQKQITVGNTPENAKFDLEAQAAVNDQTIVSAENNVQIQLLNLKQALLLDPFEEFDIIEPHAIQIPETDVLLLTPDELYEKSLQTQFQIQASDLMVESALMGEKIAKAATYPTIGGGATLSTNYSNQGQTVIGLTPIVEEQDIVINGQATTIGILTQSPILEKTPYFSQLESYLSYGFGINVSMPIYSNGTIKNGVSRAKVATQKELLNNRQLKESFKVTLGKSMSDVRNAKASYDAALKTQQAQENLYNNTAKRFDIGTANSFELSRNMAQFEKSQIDVLVAKYDYIFKIKVIDYYLGRPLNLTY